MRARLLISVCDAREAIAALQGGADWIDLKLPQRGPLGPVGAHVARRIVRAVAGRAVISAAAGELVQWPHSSARDLLAVDGVSYLKLGFAGCQTDRSWKLHWRQAQHEAALSGKRLIPAAYADYNSAGSPPPLEILAEAGLSPCDYVLIDTFDKAGPGLLALLPLPSLENYLAAARQVGVRVAVAGKIGAAQLSQLPLGRIEVAAFRGAACLHGRHGRVVRRRVEALAHALSNPCVFGRSRGVVRGRDVGLPFGR